MLRDYYNDKRSLISESVTAIQIDIHPTWEEPGQHAIHLDSKSLSRITTICEVPTILKSVSYPQWSLGSRPHSPSHNILNARGAVWRSSYMTTKLTGPHQTRYAVSTQFKAWHRSQKGVVLNRHKRGLQPWNLIIVTTLSSSFSSEWTHFP
jgi:hypothetical protein